MKEFLYHALGICGEHWLTLILNITIFLLLVSTFCETYSEQVYSREINEQSYLYSFCISFAQGMIWFQTYGQFIWPWIKNNPWTVSIVSGTLVSYIFIKATYFRRYLLRWSIMSPRLLGFAAVVC